MLGAVRTFDEYGIKLYATAGTHAFLTENNVPATLALWPNADDNAPNPPADAVQAIDLIARGRDGGVNLVINIPSPRKADEITNGYAIRRAAVDYGVTLITNRQIAERLAEAVESSREGYADLTPESWREYVGSPV